MHDEILQRLEQFRPPGAIPIEFAMLLFMLVAMGTLLGVVSLFAGLSTYAERKIAAHMQARMGPMRVGYHGILQFLADGLKLITKEDLVPRNADGLLFRLAPYVVFMAAFATFAAVPFADGLAATDLNIGIFYVLAASSGGVVGLLMAGWASGNKWSLLGAMRSAAQIVSYEIPVGMSLLAILLVVGSLNLTDIVEAQNTEWFGAGGWFVFRYGPFSIAAFLIYYTAILAETNRTPFDIPEAESELVAGYHTEYSGMRMSFFFMSEYGSMLVTSLIGSIVFLGGWLPIYPAALGQGDTPFLLGGLQLAGLNIGAAAESVFWLMAKAIFLVFVMMWLRWTLPRYRVDQLMDLCWKKLIPLSFINMAAIATCYTLWVDVFSDWFGAS